MTVCRNCNIELDNNNWHLNKQLHNDCICKKCVSEYNKKYKKSLNGKKSSHQSELKRIGKRNQEYQLYNNTHKLQKQIWQKNHKLQRKQSVTKYRKTELGRLANTNCRLTRRTFGFNYIPLNDCREDGWVGHHIDKDYVIFIPEELHKSIYHSIIKNINIDLINDAVYNWFIEYYLKR